MATPGQSLIDARLRPAQRRGDSWYEINLKEAVVDA
jgi:hypothetical protein